MRLGIDRNSRTKPTGKVELLVIDIDGGDIEPHRFGILHRHMAKATNAGNHHPVTRLGVRDFKAFIDRHASAKDRCNLIELDVLRQMPNEIRICNHIISKAAIDRIASIQLFFTECFPAAKAMHAMTASRVEPWNADAITFLDVFYPFTHCRHKANAFMSGDKWRIGLHRPIAFRGMKISVTDAGCLNGYLNLTVSRLRNWNFVNCQWFAEFADYSRFHCLCHWKFLLFWAGGQEYKPCRPAPFLGGNRGNDLSMM